MEPIVDTGSGLGPPLGLDMSFRAPRKAAGLALYSSILALMTVNYAVSYVRFEARSDTFAKSRHHQPPQIASLETPIWPPALIDPSKQGGFRTPFIFPLLLRYGERLKSSVRARPANLMASPGSPGSVTYSEVPGEPKRIRVRDRSGKTVIARVHGGSGDETHVVLPDGQLGVPEELTYTEEPFYPTSPADVAAALISGPFATFELTTTSHYLVFYKSSETFAKESARLLEDLYSRLLDTFRRKGIPVHESEFPLAAVIFGTEKEFREFREVDPQVRAYYEIYTNRIYLYETSEHDEAAPEVAALRRPQTVAHEGTHQILQNIGVQPRLAAWPPWLVEGLAEYCATPVTTRKGTSWAFLGAVNAQHLATIRDLANPLAGQFPGSEGPVHIGRRPDQPLVDYLIRKTELTPTDYALSWAVTHHLALKRGDAFAAYLRTMSRVKPLESKTPEEHRATFSTAFGEDFSKLDREINRYLGKLKVNYPLPYYTLIFEQRMPQGRTRRAAIVSQSPSMINQWIDTVSLSEGEPPLWQVFEFETRTPALATADRFVCDP